ncbi:MAG: M56 family metallopeptidase, partial [Owenweeksia sp.]
IYYGLLGIIFWFNPFIHLLAREVRQTHECLADQKALQETSREVYARMLLSSTFGKEWSVPMTIGTVNPFFNSSLLKT